jgi:hypothetical protein
VWHCLPSLLWYLGRSTYLLLGSWCITILVRRSASVLIEKILRANPDVGKIYVMIKAKDAEEAFRRLQTEVRCPGFWSNYRYMSVRRGHKFLRMPTAT